MGEERSGEGISNYFEGPLGALKSVCGRLSDKLSRVRSALGLRRDCSSCSLAFFLGISSNFAG